MTDPVLLIDDNPITRKLVRFSLESQGFSILEAADAASAEKLFAERAVTLVLLDLVLPDLDGFSLLGKLRAMPRGEETPILAFSGLISRADEARLSVAGFDDLISKPVEPSRLLQIVRAHVPTQSAAPTVAGNGRRIIVADDDAVQRKLALFRIQKAGFDVVGAADGNEALALAREKRPDAIVSDVLMPGLDGFGLCLALRQDPALATVPVVLATNSYLDPADQELAKKAGANSLVLRTPDLTEVTEALRTCLSQRPPSRAVPAVPSAEMERERAERVVRQLERQVALNSGVNQRASLLSAELSILTGISEALASNTDFESSLQLILGACLDAGGISAGAMYLHQGSDLRVVRFGATRTPDDKEVRGFFGERALLESTIASRSLLALPSSAIPQPRAEALLKRANAASLVLAPLAAKGTSFGALLMSSSSLELVEEDRLVFVQGVAGQVSQALALAQAFEKTQEAERKAAAQAAVLQTVLTSLADGVAVVDAQGRFTMSNPAAQPVIDVWPRAENALEGALGVFGTDQMTRLAGGDLPPMRAMRGESVDSAELFVRHGEAPAGVWLSVNARPLTTGDGGVAVFRDITAEKAAQTQLMVSDRMASVGMLAAGVAHEINNPLAAVLANLEFLAEDLAADPTAEQMPPIRATLDEARGACKRIRQIMHDLRIFSRHEDQLASAIDAAEVLDSSARMAWNEIRHRAKLVKAYGRVPRVAATESRLGQVFLNLVVNAAQAVPEGDAEKNQITLTTRLAPDGRVAVEISDTGVGISPSAISKLFTPFFTTKGPGSGTGLGLAISHRIVSTLGGEIQVESTPGRGTTFRVLLIPALTEELPMTAPPLVPRRAARRGRILVLDDEPMVGSAVSRVLSRHHDVVTLTRGADALDAIRGGAQFDVIICDIMMPQMSGQEFFNEMQKHDASTAGRIIFLTGGAFTPAARAFLDTITNTQVDKPFDPRALLDLVNQRIT